MRIRIPFKLWKREDKIAYIVGLVIYFLMYSAGLIFAIEHNPLGLIFFVGAILGVVIHQLMAIEITSIKV